MDPVAFKGLDRIQIKSKSELFKPYHIKRPGFLIVFYPTLEFIPNVYCFLPDFKGSNVNIF
jgi:hypothetical protein